MCTFNSYYSVPVIEDKLKEKTMQPHQKESKFHPRNSVSYVLMCTFNSYYLITKNKLCKTILPVPVYDWYIRSTP